MQKIVKDKITILHIVVIILGIIFISLWLIIKCFFEDFIAKKVKSFAMKYHKCHLKIKVGTRTEDRVAAGIINFNLIFSSEPTDSGP